MAGVHYSLEQEVESFSLQPLANEIVSLEVELVYECLEKHVVDPRTGSSQRPHPFLRHNMDEKASTQDFFCIVLLHFDSYRKLVVDGEQRDCKGCAIVVFWVYLDLETGFCDGELQQGVLKVCILIALREGTVKGQKRVFFGNNFQICKKLSFRVRTFQRYPKILKEIFIFIQDIASGFNFLIRGKGEIIVLEIDIEAVDSWQVPY